MKKDDYRQEFEQHRQEINLEDENGESLLTTRMDLHKKNHKPKRRSRNTLINSIFALFTLILVGIFIYVLSDIFSSSKNQAAELDDSLIRLETNEQLADKKQLESNDKNALEEKENESDQQEKNDSELEGAGVDEQDPGKEDLTTDPTSNENDELESEQSKDEPADELVESFPKTHTVATGETLYRISVNYYKSDQGISKIMEANGLTSNNIMVGQKLIIP